MHAIKLSNGDSSLSSPYDHLYWKFILQNFFHQAHNRYFNWWCISIDAALLRYFWRLSYSRFGCCRSALTKAAGLWCAAAITDISTALTTLPRHHCVDDTDDASDVKRTCHRPRRRAESRTSIFRIFTAAGHGAISDDAWRRNILIAYIADFDNIAAPYRYGHALRERNAREYESTLSLWNAEHTDEASELANAEYNSVSAMATSAQIQMMIYMCYHIWPSCLRV